MYPVALRSFRDPQKPAEQIERQPLFTCAVEDHDIGGDKNLRPVDFRIVVDREPAEVSAPLGQ